MSEDKQSITSTISKEYIEDLRDLFYDWEFSDDEPVNRAMGQRSKDEVLEEIKNHLASLVVPKNS